MKASYKEIDGIRVIQDEDAMIEALLHGEAFAHWESGNSMFPLLKSQEYVIIRPIDDISQVNVGDAVFCRLHGSENWMTHMVWIKNNATGECLIGSTNGDLYGWTNEILGIGYRTKNRVKETWTEPEEEIQNE